MSPYHMIFLLPNLFFSLPQTTPITVTIPGTLVYTEPDWLRVLDKEFSYVVWVKIRVP